MLMSSCLRFEARNPNVKSWTMDFGITPERWRMRLTPGGAVLNKTGEWQPAPNSTATEVLRLLFIQRRKMPEMMSLIARYREIGSVQKQCSLLRRAKYADREKGQHPYWHITAKGREYLLSVHIDVRRCLLEGTGKGERWIPKGGTAPAYILLALWHKGPLSFNDLSRVLAGMNNRTLQAAKKRLQRAGYVETTGKQRTFRYSVTEAGAEVAALLAGEQREAA